MFLDGVDPEQGYAKTILDTANRMNMSAKVLSKELLSDRGPASVSKSSFGDSIIFLSQRIRENRYQDFL